MDEYLYNKEIKCPVCSNKFEIIKVKVKGVRVASRDTDFCVYYEGINPMFYDVQVCEHCGYAAQSDKFDAITSTNAEVLKNHIMPRWSKRSFSNERSIDTAIEAFKLTLFNLQLTKAKPSELSRICIRLAWLYRIKKDVENENIFLKFSLRQYREAYEKENLPADKLDEFTCMFMIAELCRRLKEYEEAVKWFSRLISSPEARKNASLINAARDQFQLTKEEMNAKAVSGKVSK